MDGIILWGTRGPKNRKMTILAIPNSSFIAHHFIYWFNLAHTCYLTSEIKQGVINLNCLLWSGLKVSGLGSRALKVISTAGCTSGNHTRWESAIKGVAQIGCLSVFVFLQKFLKYKKNAQNFLIVFTICFFHRARFPENFVIRNFHRWADTDRISLFKSQDRSGRSGQTFLRSHSLNIFAAAPLDQDQPFII